MAGYTDPLKPLRDRFHGRRPLRAGSLIVTLYGDCVSPRGGALWLGSINTLIAPFGVEPGLVRTALSRLVTEGLFARSRAGKSSYYRLSAAGEATFAAAAERIYRAQPPAWDGRLRLAVLGSADAKLRARQREGLAAAGCGQLAPNVMVSPADIDAGVQADDIVLLDAAKAGDGGGPADLRTLAAQSWQLDTLAAGYAAYLEAVAPLAADARSLARLDDPSAFELRLLLIHEWRRLVLRDPSLPEAMLPAGWPGAIARDATRRIYRAIGPASERWLSSQALGEKGTLPPPSAAARQRFG